MIQLADDVEGYLRASEVSRERVEDIRSHVKEGETVEVMIINGIARPATSASRSRPRFC